MGKFELNPQVGTIASSKCVPFRIAGIENPHRARVRIENATHGVSAYVAGSTDAWLAISEGATSVTGDLNLSVPDHASESAVSLFAFVQNEQTNGSYEVSQILPAVYQLTVQEDFMPGVSLNLDPIFVGTGDQCKISLAASSNTRYMISINDRRMMILTDAQGKGSINFVGRDVLIEKKLPVMKRYPIYIYSPHDNYVSKRFSGINIHILPSDIVSRTVDPRCVDPSWPTSNPPQTVNPWSPPLACLTGGPETPTPTAVRNDLPLQPNTPANNRTNHSTAVTGEHGTGKVSTALLPGGTALNCLTSVNNTSYSINNPCFNKQKVFVVEEETSLDDYNTAGKIGTNPGYKILYHGNVAVAPKPGLTDPMQIYINQDTYEWIPSDTTNVSVFLFDPDFGCYSWPVAGKLSPGSYVPYYGFLLDTSLRNVINQDWKFCTYAVIYKFYSNYINGTTQTISLEFPCITDVYGNTVSAIDAAIGTNEYNTSSLQQVYIIASGLVEDKVQLFLYSWCIKQGDSKVRTVYYLQSDTSYVFGWKQLTFVGNNKNPRVYVDRQGSLHVFWESDRSGSTQIYYGVLGPSLYSTGNAVLSSLFDKEAKLLQSDTLPAGAVTNISTVHEPSIVSPYFSELTWTFKTTNSGTVSVLPDNHITVTGNPLRDTAMAFYSLDGDESKGVAFDGKVDQIQYQVSFDVSSPDFDPDYNADIKYSDIAVENYWNQWKSSYAETTDASFSNTPVYVGSYNNKFLIAKQEDLYGRIWPMIGSYKNMTTGNEQFVLAASGETENLRHFFLGLMPETVRFSAKNIQTKDQFRVANGLTTAQADDRYDYENSDMVYTGRFRLAIVMNGQENYMGSPTTMDFYGTDSKNSRIVRMFSDPFDLYPSSNFKIMVGYRRIYAEDVDRYFGETIDKQARCRYVCSVTVYVNNVPKFAQSFVVDLSDAYRKFDIGFGFPSGGYYLTDEFLPYESNVFGEETFTVEFENITISTPSIDLNDEVVTVPLEVRDPSAMVTEGVGPSEGSGLYYNRSFVTFGLSANISDPAQGYAGPGDFLQVPLTLDSVNESPNIDRGLYDELHLVWQCNRGSYWNIYYTNAMNKGLPFRLETQVTNTESNSLCPSVAVGKNGRRCIVWHDDRDGKYEVYCARSLVDYGGGVQPCNYYEVERYLANTNPSINELDIEFSVGSGATGYYHFALQFYNSNFTQLLTTVSSVNDVSGWLYDFKPFPTGGAYVEGTVRLTYLPPSSLALSNRLYGVKLIPVRVA